LAPNDLLLLYTDGLFEVTEPGGEEFGLDRLVDAARRRMSLPLEALVDGLIEDIRAFGEGAEFPDDVCLLGVGVRRCGTQNPSRT
jgi:sigma-B regulation protein RsbU (phosphoserine phosphatase)